MHHQARALHRKWAAQSPGNCPCECETSIERGHPISCHHVEHAGRDGERPPLCAHTPFLFSFPLQLRLPNHDQPRERWVRGSAAGRGKRESISALRERKRAPRPKCAPLLTWAGWRQCEVLRTRYATGELEEEGREGGVQLWMSPHLNVLRAHSVIPAMLSLQLAFLPVPSRHTRNSSCRHRSALDLSKPVPLSPSCGLRCPRLPCPCRSAFCFVHDTHTLLI